MRRRKDDLLLALWARENEIEYLHKEIERLKRKLNFAQWATRELVDYVEDVIRPGVVPSWERFRRMVVRLKGEL